MVYKYTNSKGKDWYLHTVKSTRGYNLYYFSGIEKARPDRQIDLPPEFEVIENPRSGLPVVRRKLDGNKRQA